MDEALGESFTQAVICVKVSWDVLVEVDLWAARWVAILSWSLITVPAVESEHKLVGNLVQEGDELAELWVIHLERLSQLDLH